MVILILSGCIWSLINMSKNNSLVINEEVDYPIMSESKLIICHLPEIHLKLITYCLFTQGNNMPRCVIIWERKLSFYNLEAYPLRGYEQQPIILWKGKGAIFNFTLILGLQVMSSDLQDH